MSYRPYASIISEAQATNSTMSINMINNTGSAIPILTPVAVDNDGKLSLIDVSDSDSIFSVAGVTTESIPDNSNGRIMLSGRIENITTPFSHGDYLYVSKSGGLTNIVPAIGMAGFVEEDAVIRVGVIVKNSNIPTQKDLLVRIQLVGKL